MPKVLTSTKPPARVLLIEDDALDRSLFKRTLRKTHADIVCVDRLATGLERLKNEPFDLVVSDLNLPDSEWHETFAKLTDASNSTPVVVITGHEEFVQELGERQSGPYVFLKSAVHHDVFPLIALGQMLEHLIDESEEVASKPCPEV